MVVTVILVLAAPVLLVFGTPVPVPEGAVSLDDAVFLAGAVFLVGSVVLIGSVFLVGAVFLMVAVLLVGAVFLVVAVLLAALPGCPGVGDFVCLAAAVLSASVVDGACFISVTCFVVIFTFPACSFLLMAAMSAGTVRRTSDVAAFLRVGILWLCE